MKFPRLSRLLPDWTNAALAILSAVLLILAFPDFDLWLLAWFALVPLLWAIRREHASPARSFVLGWLWGLVFFTGSCWWLTFAPITYAGFPWPVAYFLLICVTAMVGVFPGFFGLILSVVLKRFGPLAICATPFIWVFTEFLRYWITGNNWNAVGYSQAFSEVLHNWAPIGGILLVTFIIILLNSAFVAAIPNLSKKEVGGQMERLFVLAAPIGLILVIFWTSPVPRLVISDAAYDPDASQVVAIQPNVPMSGLSFEKWQDLRRKHVQLAESALAANNERRTTNNERRPTIITVVFPESPMNFQYEEDAEFREFVHAFAAKHDVQVLFNSAEPDPQQDKYFNSAVLVGPDGREIGQYDKIYLVPFGESVPAPLQSIVPAFVGSFSYGNEFDLLPLGDVKAGVMICFESHFGELGREYVRNGADVIIEMTNDGYLGPTPVLKQHLANAVFRAVETNRPVLRVTNVGITAYINERGEVRDASESYTETSRVWTVAKSNGKQTLYVRYGDWFAALCSLVSIVLLIRGIGRRRPVLSVPSA